MIIIINSAPYTDEFVEPIVQCLTVAGITAAVVGYDQIPFEINCCSSVIISASPKADDIIESQIPFYDWLADYPKPVLGICHGHQMLAVMHGAMLKRSGEGEEGICQVQKEIEHPLFAGLEDSFEVEQHHQYSVSLPDNFRLLASSEQCQNQAMAHLTKPVFSVQFHAEKTPDILLNFLSLAR